MLIPQWSNVRKRLRECPPTGLFGLHDRGEGTVLQILKPSKKLLGRWRRKLFGKQFLSSLEVERFGDLEVAYRSNSFDRLVVTTNLVDEHFLKELPDYRMGPEDVVIDVGAHIGAFALSAARRAPHGHVHAVEACLESFNLLRINVALNGIHNVTPYRVALSDRRGECTLSYDTDGWGHSVVTNFADRGETVPTISLEDFMKENGVERCHLMKLNCEGGEFPILMGTPASVLKRFGYLTIAVHEDLNPRFSIPALIAHLESAGLEVEVHEAGSRGQLIAKNPGFDPRVVH